MSTPPPSFGPEDASVYYRFSDGQGRVHIVDSIDKVPGPLRARAERIELAVRGRDPTSPRAGSGVHWTSFGLGLGAAVLAVLFFWSMRRGSGPLLKLVLLAGVAALLGGAYFGWIRRQSGQSDSLLAAPSALIDDARRAVDKANLKQREEQEALKEIERQAK
jgi:hypothetical protein